MKRRTAFALGAALIGGGLIYGLYPQHTLYDPNHPHTVANEMLAFLFVQEIEVNDYAKEHKTLLGAGATLKLEPPSKDHPLFDEATVENDGGMTIRNNAKGLTVTVTPALTEGGVVWACSAEPAKYAPTSCRHN